MGFPCGSISLPNSISLIILISLLRYAKHVASVILKRPSSEVVSADQEFDVYSTGFHEFSASWPSPSLVPATASVLAAAQKRLLVVEFGDFMRRWNLHADEGASLCAICLQEIERRHEIREPTKCRHAFHKECLDGWVDEGHVTCPLCRTALFEGEEERSSVGDLRTTERTNTYFFHDYY
ncbi:hypothetical protein NL676_011059 [Syzygium grande]|nr:hypothetical protein NL676_011059 [Syzygium grande]